MNWDRKPEFKAYVDAIENIPDLFEKKYADRSFFGDAPAYLFGEYCKIFVKHVTIAVRPTEILVYLVGGNPTLAQLLLQWLKCAEDDDVPIASHVFDDKDAILQHQGFDVKSVSVNTRECMIYLTE